MDRSAFVADKSVNPIILPLNTAGTSIGLRVYESFKLKLGENQI